MCPEFIRRKNIWTAILFLGFLGFFIAGCAQNEPDEFSTLVSGGQLTPYQTATPKPTSKTEDDSKIQSPKSTDIPAPTPTPFVYAVVENDTLTGIAFRHSVVLEDLIAANPGIDPNFLTIGLTLTIPIEGVISAALPTQTPVPIAIQPPICYQLADGSLQCLVVVENDQTSAVENVEVLISLRSTDGRNSLSKTAIAPLNIIPAGQQVAVAATFDPPIPPNFQAQASLLSVIPISPDDQRYLKTRLQKEETEISANGQQAAVNGSIELLADQSDASVIWVSAFAYDAQNKIVGIRKWVADDILGSGNQISFDFIVYSLGYPIEYVEVLTETRP